MSSSTSLPLLTPPPHHHQPQHQDALSLDHHHDQNQEDNDMDPVGVEDHDVLLQTLQHFEKPSYDHHDHVHTHVHEHEHEHEHEHNEDAPIHSHPHHTEQDDQDNHPEEIYTYETLTDAVDALRKQGVSVDVEADGTEEETRVDGYQQDHDQDQDQDHRQHDVDPDLERDLQTGNDIGVDQPHDGDDRDAGEENGDIDINIDAQIDREETSSELSPTPGPHVDMDDVQTQNSGPNSDPATNKRNSRSNANSKSHSKSASASASASGSGSSKGKSKDPDLDDKPVKKKHPRPGRPRNPNPPLGAHQVPSNLTPVSLLNNQGMRAKEALGDHSGSAGREVLSVAFGSGGGFGVGVDAGRAALSTNNNNNSDDDNDGNDVEGVRSGEDIVSGSSLEESMGLRETCWEEDKDGRVLNDEGKKRVEEIVRGIAGQLARLHAATNLNYLLLTSPPFPPPPTFPTLSFSPPSENFWTSLRGTPAHNLSKFLSLSHPSLTTRRMAIPTGARSLDIKSRLNGRMREMVRTVSGLGEAEMKWTRPESMVQAYGVKVVGWPLEETGEEGKGAVPLRNPSNNSAQQNRYLLELVEDGTLRIEKATREDKEAFAESFAATAAGGSSQAGEGSVPGEGQGPDNGELAGADGEEGAAVQVKKKRGGGKKPAGQAAKKGKGKRSSKAQREEQTPIVEFDPTAGGYPQVEQLGSGEIGTPLGAEGPESEMQVDVETTLQDGLDRELEVARQAASGLGATGYELVLPQETTLMAAAAAAAEAEAANASSSSSTQNPVTTKRLRPLALNPDKDGLPRPRPKSFLVLGPDGSIVPTSQRQLRAEAKRKGELIDGGSSGKKRRKIQPVEQEDAVRVANDNEDEVIRQLADVSADAAAVDAQQNGDSAANMFLQDTEDASESIEVGDQDSAMVLAMMGDSAQMMRLMQQQAAVASSSTSSPRQLQQQQQPGGMGTYGPPPGTTHGQHAQMLLQQQLRHQRGEDTPNRTADEQIMELYQVTGPDFSQAISRAGSVSTGGLRTGSASGGSPYDLERGVGTDARRQLAAALGRNGDPTSSGREEQDPQHLFNNFQMLNPYISAAQDLAYRPNSGDGQHSDGNHFDTTDDMVVTGGREHEGDDAEIDVEGEMDAIGQFAQHVGGNERDDGTTGM